MQYELDNPSDSYTFIAENREIAALTVFAFRARYGATPQSGDDNERVPIFFFGGASEWYKETFGRTPQDGIDALSAQ
ncbi:hypothetical protein FACS1894187_20950 [Synergistales bacterium]|nr:hypothetical protein FACS1894187_20950 [Synergistales bacterium]